MSKGSETRQRIIAKAAPLFNRKGYDGCSMQDIVEAVGLEKGSLYGHFANKEELALAAFDYAWSQTSTARIAGLDTVSDPVEKLRMHVRNVTETPSFAGGCPLINATVDNDDGNSALKKRAKAALKGWQDFLQAIIIEGQEKNDIRPEINPETTASVMITLLEGAMALDRLDKKSTMLAKVGEHLLEYLDTSVRQPA